MNNKGMLRWFAYDDSMHQKRSWKLLYDKQVGKKMIAGVYYTINKVEFSIYKFPALGTKKDIN